MLESAAAWLKLYKAVWYDGDKTAAQYADQLGESRYVDVCLSVLKAMQAAGLVVGLRSRSCNARDVDDKDAIVWRTTRVKKLERAEIFDAWKGRNKTK